MRYFWESFNKIIRNICMDVKDKTKGVEEVKRNKVRITLTCRSLKSVENGNKMMFSVFPDSGAF